MAKTLRKREEIPQEDKWRLEDIFPSDQEWEKRFKETEQLISLAEKYKGNLAQSPSMFIEGMEWADKLSLNLEDLYTYAKMRRDENNKISLYQGMTDRAGMLSVQAGSALSFIVPEILAIPEEKLTQIRRDPRLKLYDHFLRMFYVKRNMFFLPKKKSYWLKQVNLPQHRVRFSVWPMMPT